MEVGVVEIERLAALQPQPQSLCHAFIREVIEPLVRLDRHEALPTVVSGDFNSYEGERTVEIMKGRFRSALEAANGREPEKTWPTPVNTFDPSPPGCLDYIFVAGGEVREAALAFDTPHALDPDLFPSDHLGVAATVRVEQTT